MEEQFLRRIISYIKENEMIAENDDVFAGVSGGVDSMCLLVVLLACRRQIDFTLRVIHVEHGIRGAESVADAAYVEQFCREQRVPCEIVRVDAVSYAKKRHLSVEEAARMLRYEAFEESAVQTSRARIALAHHREDQAETVLWQMVRGSDVRGLGGMRPKRGRIIRPLLFVSRAEIENYLNTKGIHWREDSTNGSLDYTRNCIRQEVLPVLHKLNAQAAQHIFETAECLQETEDYLCEQTKHLYEQYVRREPNGGLLIKKELLDVRPLLARRVVYEALCRSLDGARDISAEHVRLLGSLLSLQVGRVLHLPCGRRAKRVYEGVKLFAEKGMGDMQSTVAVEEGMEKLRNEFSAGDCEKDMQTMFFLPEQVHMEVLTQFDSAEISKKKYTKWFNYDKIKDNVQIRCRKSGDYLVIDGAGHRQKLSRYLVNEKIPQEERDRLLLVADGSHIMWVIGHRISDYYKVDKNTTKVLKVQLSGGKEDE